MKPGDLVVELDKSWITNGISPKIGLVIESKMDYYQFRPFSLIIYWAKGGYVETINHYNRFDLIKVLNA